MTEADFAAVLEEISGRPYAAEIAGWVHGTGELPLQDLLQRHGVAVLEEPSQLAQTLGLRVQESAGVQVKTVLRNGAAERAGFAAGDEWLAVEPVVTGRGKTHGDAWRLTKLDDLTLYAGPHKKLVAIVARDKRLLRLELTLPRAENTWRLVSRDSALVSRWLAPAS